MLEWGRAWTRLLSRRWNEGPLFPACRSVFHPGSGTPTLVALSIMMSAACQRGISVAGGLFGSATPAPSHIRRFVSGSYHVALVTGSTAVNGRALVCGHFFVYAVFMRLWRFPG